MTDETAYRGYKIVYDPKPIPFRGHDWDWFAEDYDGPGDDRCGSAESEEEAMLAIDRQIDDEWMTP